LVFFFLGLTDFFLFLSPLEFKYSNCWLSKARSSSLFASTTGILTILVLINFQTFVLRTEKSFCGFSLDRKRFFFYQPVSYVNIGGSLALFIGNKRYRRRMFSDVYETIISCLNISFCASFMEIFCGKEIWNTPFIDILSQSFLLIAVILSWIGMRAIAGFGWIFLFILAITRIAGLNVAMGHLGIAYVFSAFVSIGLQTKDSIEMISSFKNDFIGVSNQIDNDIVTSSNVVKKLR
jgi:hypothetical protein